MRDGVVRILAIETSCDETAVAIVEDGKTVLAQEISSQTDVHRRYGGVVPEIASREHVSCVTTLVEQVIQQAHISRAHIDAVAVTQGPGLVGSLIVGIVAAKSLAYALDVPLLGVHHIAGHIYANALVAPLQFPLLAVVVSGGHTELVYMDGALSFRMLGATRDDAIGEAFDKVARTLGLPYPGGPHVEQLAQQADEEIVMPRAWLDDETFDFSFSGVKSAVMAAVNQARMRGDVVNKPALALGFQRAVTDVVVTKAIKAAVAHEVRQVVLCGGVAANRGIREALATRCAALSLPFVVPPLAWCTDNAAMVGACAHALWREKRWATFRLKPKPLFSLAQFGKGVADA